MGGVICSVSKRLISIGKVPIRDNKDKGEEVHDTGLYDKLVDYRDDLFAFGEAEPSYRLLDRDYDAYEVVDDDDGGEDFVNQDRAGGSMVTQSLLNTTNYLHYRILFEGDEKEDDYRLTAHELTTLRDRYGIVLGTADAEAERVKTDQRLLH